MATPQASVRVDTSGLKVKVQRIKASTDPKKVLTAIGIRQMRWIDQNFRRGGLERRWAPLKPSTIAARRKGSSKPLMDTGGLRRAFNYRVLSTQEVEVGAVGREDRPAGSLATYGEIARWHHGGTRPYTIIPKTKKALRWRTGRGAKAFAFAKVVHHPGLPSRPLLPTRLTARKLAIEVINAIVRRLR